MKAVVVHLSDIHIKAKDDKVLNRYSHISDIVNTYQNSSACCFIVVSGDIAFSGRREEYDLAREFIQEIVKALEPNYGGGVHVIVAPGNHDCNFSKSNSVRDILVASMSEGDENIDNDIIDQCAVVQEEFFEFRDHISTTQITKNNTLWYRYDFHLGDTHASFDCLNLSWCSQLNESQGKLVFPIEQFEGELEETSDLRFFVFHHPLNWIQQGQYQSLRSKIRSKSDIVLCGHEHYGAASSIDDKRNGASLVIDGSALQAHGSSEESEFHVLDIDLDSYEYQYSTYTSCNGQYDKTFSTAGQSLHVSTPRTTRNDLSVDNSFMSWILDPGANFTHPYKPKIELTDIYVHPDLEEISTEDGEMCNISAGSIIPNIEKRGKIILRGDESHGKTTLLKQLFAESFDSGYAPLYVDSSTINKASDTGLDKIYTRAIESQYGVSAVDKYLSTPMNQKIILLDDLDNLGVSDRFQRKVINYFENLFDKVILTSSESVGVGEISALSDDAADLSHYSNYRIRNFGNRLRYELIKKWRSIGNDYNLSSSELIARVDHAEKVLNNVIGKNLVPKAPVYILTILQSLEAGNPNTDFHNGGLGYYYQYLITQALGVANVSADELDEFFNFLSQLAWYVYNQSNTEISTEHFSSFSEQYSNEYARVDPGKRVSRLLKSNILSSRGRFLSFSYPYIYYYFLGKYFSRNLTDNAEVQSIVAHCCNHIYLHENANIIMFVTHHTNDKQIISNVLNNLKNTFSKHSPVTFDGDVDSLNDFVDKTANIVYLNSNPDEVRKSHSEIKDEIEESERDNEPEQRECENDLDLASKLNSLIKTSEILGQLLKSYYGSIRNDSKKEIITEIFSAPLRALRDFYVIIERDSEALVQEIESILESRDSNLPEEKRKSVAQRICYQVIGSITTALILNPAVAVASPYLREVIQKCVDENPTTGFKLIKLATDLELPDEVNISEIKALYEDNKDDMFCQRVLQSIVLKHLYFFKVSESEKQQICSAINVSIDYQNKIDFRSRGSKS